MFLNFQNRQVWANSVDASQTAPVWSGVWSGSTRATEILKSKSVRSTDDVIGTCVWQSQIVMKTNDSSFSSKSVSEIDYLSNTL